jgi:long-subunit fatty acid transport protein
LTTDSTGGRVGFDFSYPFQSGWRLNAGLAYAPSVSTRLSGSVGGGAQSVTATGTGWDAQASMRYTAAAHWNVEVGYRFVQEIQSALSISGVAVCPCHTQWEGPFIGIGANF